MQYKFLLCMSYAGILIVHFKLSIKIQILFRFHSNLENRKMKIENSKK